jgi:Tfp pilus assembly protein FimT
MEYRRAARDVNSVLREARTRAIARNRDNTVVIDSVNRRYRLIQGVDTVHDWVVLPTGVNFNASPSIVFRPSGVVNSVGDIIIRIQDNAAVMRYQITVTPTGRIQITR